VVRASTSSFTSKVAIPKRHWKISSGTGVHYYGPRVNENGEIHIDFEDPDGHMLEYWARKSFEPLSDKLE
jgi:hypothetical protein